MLRVKRASSPERLARSVTAVTSEQRYFVEQGFEQVICKAVLKQKRLRAVSEPWHSQNACHSESSIIFVNLV